VLSANVHRRHLTSEQKREAISRFIKADPKASDSSVAKVLKVSDHTVADVRKETGSNSQNANLSHLPLERAKAAVRENPSASANEIAKTADVSRATAQRAQKLVAIESKQPTTMTSTSTSTEPESTPPPTTSSTTTEDHHPREASQPKLEVIANPKQALQNRFVAVCKKARRIGLSDSSIMKMVQEALSSI
jgi:hypothetical protein